MIEYIFDNKEKPIIQNNIININPKSHGPYYEKDFNFVEPEPKDLTNLKKKKNVKVANDHPKSNVNKINGIKVAKNDGKFVKSVGTKKK